MGWRDCQIDVGTFSDHEMDARQPEVVGLFGGYLFINASTARLFGVRGPGLAPEMIDATSLAPTLTCRRISLSRGMRMPTTRRD